MSKTPGRIPARALGFFPGRVNPDMEKAEGLIYFHEFQGAMHQPGRNINNRPRRYPVYLPFRPHVELHLPIKFFRIRKGGAKEEEIFIKIMNMGIGDHHMRLGEPDAAPRNVSLGEYFLDLAHIEHRGSIGFQIACFGVG